MRPIGQAPGEPAGVEQLDRAGPRSLVVGFVAAEEIEAPGQMTYGSQAAAASHVFAQQRDLALREQAERRFHAVDHALARLAAGTYAICETCGGEIPAERQELIPWATTCVSCGSHVR